MKLYKIVCRCGDESVVLAAGITDAITQYEKFLRVLYSAPRAKQCPHNSEIASITLLEHNVIGLAQGETDAEKLPKA